jgi:hypothetical protein
MWEISGDDRSVDGADGSTGDPVRPHPAPLERGISAGLVGSKRGAARQYQRDPFKTR